MNIEGVLLSDLERWEKQQKEHMRFLEDQAKNDKKLFEWRKAKVVNAGISLAFTAGLFLLGFCIVAGIQWMEANYTQAQMNDFGMGVLIALVFMSVWLFIWKITNPSKPRTYYRNPEVKDWSDLDD